MYRLSLLLSVLVAVSALDFDCTTLVPNGRERGDAEHSAPFGMMMDVSRKYKSGELVSEERTVTVTIQSHVQRFNSFMVQGRRPEADEAIGTFVLSADDKTSQLTTCLNDGDTLVNKGNRLLSKVTFVWKVPTQLRNVPEIEFDVVIGFERQFWIFNTMMILVEGTETAPQHPTAEEERRKTQVHVPDDDVSQQDSQPSQEESTGTGEDPDESEKQAKKEQEEADRRDHVNQNMHDGRTEQELAKQEEERKKKEMENEDKYSEGDWLKMEEQERKQHEREIREEEMEYERLQAEEEHERQRRIQFEIRDKEEHDRKINQPQQPQGESVDKEIDFGDVDGVPLSNLSRKSD